MKHYKFQGWIKCGMNGQWNPMCAGVSELQVHRVLQKLRPEELWTETLVLPLKETPWTNCMFAEEGEGPCQS